MFCFVFFAGLFGGCCLVRNVRWGLKPFGVEARSEGAFFVVLDDGRFRIGTPFPPSNAGIPSGFCLKPRKGAGVLLGFVSLFGFFKANQQGHSLA